MKIQKIEKFEKEENRWWIRVWFEDLNNPEWRPTFIELAKILREIAKCEDEQYPYGQGKEFMKAFLIEAIDKEFFDENVIQSLMEKFPEVTYPTANTLNT